MTMTAWILAMVLTCVVSMIVGVIIGASIMKENITAVIQAYERTCTNPSMHVVSKILELIR